MNIKAGSIALAVVLVIAVVGVVIDPVRVPILLVWTFLVAGIVAGAEKLIGK